MDEEFLNFVTIQLMKNCKEPLYVQLYHQISKRIMGGEISHGYLLPPVRKLAGFLGINAGTVMNAYKLLEKNGYIFSRAGSGSFVAELSGEIEPMGDGLETVLEMAALEQSPQGGAYINLASVALNPELISVEQFKQVMIKVLDRDRGYAFGYQESQGFYPLRESIAESVRVSGVRADAGNVQIISGAQQGIDIVAKAFLDYGDYVFVERPTYPGAIAAFRARGAKIVEIPMAEGGISIDVLEDQLRRFRPKLIYVMPNIQNPTGYSYSVGTRNRLMGLARYYQTVILEDDYISELYYGTEKMAPLKAIDRDDRVIYLKSFSKIFMPGLRLAFLIVPQSLINRLMTVKQISDISTSGLMQRVFDLYLREGIWHAHIGAIRNVYLRQFKHILDMMRLYLPDCVRHAIPQGGLSIWLTLPGELSAKAIVAEAQYGGVLLTEGSNFFVRRAANCLRISFATATEQELARGMLILGKVIENALSKRQ